MHESVVKITLLWPACCVGRSIVLKNPYLNQFLIRFHLRITSNSIACQSRLAIIYISYKKFSVIDFYELVKTVNENFLLINVNYLILFNI